MKYAIIIPDGAADRSIDALAGQTPLEAAETPNMDFLAQTGRLGTVAFDDRKRPASEPDALLGLLSYDTHATPVGAAALEALGRGLQASPTEQFFCCNLVTVTEGGLAAGLSALRRLFGGRGAGDKVLTDAMAGNISEQEAAAVVELLNEHLSPMQVQFHLGDRYRHLMSTLEPLHVSTTVPYELVGRRLRRGWPGGPDAQKLIDLMELGAAALRDHEINAIRRELGESPITGMWLWGEGPLTDLPAFADKFEISGAMVADDPVAVGAGRHIGWETIDIPAAGEYTTESLTEVGLRAAQALDNHDLVCVHTAWPDAASLAGDIAGKVCAIEAVDRVVVGELIRRLRAEEPDWRILVAPTRTTQAATRQRVHAPSPFVMAGAGVESVLHQPFNEETAADADVHIRRSWELMEFFLTVR